MGGFRLNALSGIGGVQTIVGVVIAPDELSRVLMPCRALEAFRRNYADCRFSAWTWRSLNALSGIGGVQTGGDPGRDAADAG